MNLDALLQIVQSTLQEKAPSKSLSLINSHLNILLSLPIPYLSSQSTAPSRDGPQSFPNPSPSIPHHKVLARANLKSVAHRSTLPINTLSKHISSGADAVVKCHALALRECGLALRFGPRPPASQRILSSAPTFVIRSLHEKTKIAAKKACYFVLAHGIYCYIYACLPDDLYHMIKRLCHWAFVLEFAFTFCCAN
jgi:hypothetical protein